jgi:hypothetical protein
MITSEIFVSEMAKIILSATDFLKLLPDVLKLQEKI